MDDRRPVAVTMFWNVVWMRPSSAISFDKAVGVGRFQLRQHPVVQNGLDDRVAALELFEHLRIRRSSRFSSS